MKQSKLSIRTAYEYRDTLIFMQASLYDLQLRRVLNLFFIILFQSFITFKVCNTVRQRTVSVFMVDVKISRKRGKLTIGNVNITSP